MGGGGCRLEETSPQGGLRAIGDVGRQGEGGYPKKQKIGETSFMDGPLLFQTISSVILQIQAVLIVDFVLYMPEIMISVAGNIRQLTTTSVAFLHNNRK